MLFSVAVADLLESTAHVMAAFEIFDI